MVKLNICSGSGRSAEFMSKTGGKHIHKARYSAVKLKLKLKIKNVI